MAQHKQHGENNMAKVMKKEMKIEAIAERKYRKWQWRRNGGGINV
jgi:hypothetical protein